jgi:hypothetical protein
MGDRAAATPVPRPGRALESPGPVPSPPHAMESSASITSREERGSWVRPVVLAASCLVLGFVGGWMLRGGEDDPIVLPAVGETTPATTTVPSREPTPQRPPQPLPEPSAIRLAVLNGSGVNGLAGRTAAQAQGFGYPDVAVGNAPLRSGPSVVYFRPGARPAAQRVARDLGVSHVLALPDDAALVAAAPADAQVILVLGPG